MCELCKEAARAALPGMQQHNIAEPKVDERLRSTPCGSTATPKTYAQAASIGHDHSPVVGQPITNKGNAKRPKKGSMGPPRSKLKATNGSGPLIQGDSQGGLGRLERDIAALRQQLDELRKGGMLHNPMARNLLLLNIEEPFIREAKTRRELDRRRVEEILKMAGIPPGPVIKRSHRVGRWKPPNKDRQVNTARPILVEFRDPRARDLLLARARSIWGSTGGKVHIVPDGPRAGGQSRISRDRVKHLVTKEGRQCAIPASQGWRQPPPQLVDRHFQPRE